MRTKYSLINMLTGIAGQLLRIFLAFFSRKIFIYYLSSEYLGINGVFSNVLSVLGLAELGIGSAIIYKIYKPVAEGDQDMICRLMNFYRLLYRCVAVVVLLLGLSLLPFLDLLVKDSQGIEHLSLIYLLYLLNSVSSYLFSYKNTILTAYQKSYYRIVWGHVMYTVQIVLQILVLVLTQNFILFLVIQILNQLAVNLIVVRKVDRDYPFLKEQKALPDKATRRAIARDMLALSIHSFGGVVLNGTDNLLMSAFVGLASAGIYSNYQLIFTNVNGLISWVYSAFTASVGNLAALESKQKVYEIYRTLDFFLFGIYGYASVGIFVMINPFIKLMFGEEYLFSMVMVLVLITSFYITGLRQICLKFRYAMGLFWYDRYKALAEAAINLIASLVLVRSYGVVGIILGTVISSMATVFWVEPYVFFRYGIQEEWKQKLRKYFQTYALRVASVIAAAFFSWQLCRLFPGETLGWFVLKCMICTVVYIVIFLICYSRCREFVYLKQRGRSIMQEALHKLRGQKSC